MFIQQHFLLTQLPTKFNKHRVLRIPVSMLGYSNSEIDIARYRETNTSDNMAEQHRKRIRYFSVGYAVVRGSVLNWAIPAWAGLVWSGLVSWLRQTLVVR